MRGRASKNNRQKRERIEEATGRLPGPQPPRQPPRKRGGAAPDPGGRELLIALELAGIDAFDPLGRTDEQRREALLELTRLRALAGSRGLLDAIGDLTSAGRATAFEQDPRVSARRERLQQGYRRLVNPAPNPEPPPAPDPTAPDISI
jgi:hypothetical protein